ncbi:hypothetical protein CSC70_03870 [Pseudoxanthomonas kalamensis DSM 18571]|uniref:hypothetical protein n=1 Tax=Pseudoxanthomonas kalamensis TaxID=289483 RepID=UPI001391DA77|nr:hypothetical protein [Pseudoxanthomonas kalamensis]KAF1711073.1 hypothetical protein CSC70_03870 [Pseudoxanthomonas kalamensis DSM 18571]
MNIRELTDDIIEELHDAACDGDVAEVFVIYKTQAGGYQVGVAAEDLLALVDIARQTLAHIEERRESGPLH